MKIFPSIIRAFLVIVLVLSSTQLFASEEKKPALANIIVTTSEEDMLLFVTIKDGFNQKMIEGVKSGLPVSFTFHMELKRIRTWWFNDTLLNSEITRTLTYDALKKEYSISFSEKENKTITTRSVIEAKRLISSLSGYPIVRRARLIPDAPYTLRVKVTLAENRLPLGMHYIIPFTSLWNFETDWRTVEFHY